MRVALFHLHGIAQGFPLHLLGELREQAHRGSGPAERTEPAESAPGNAARGDAVEQFGHGREQVAVVGRAADDQRVETENVAQDH